MAAPLKLDGLHKKYGDVHAVKGVSLEMKEGEIFGLLGPNGAGKTSIISILTTLEQATSGHAEVFGYDVAESARRAKPLIGIVPQETISHGFFNVEEVLGFHSGYYGIRDNQEQIDFLLTRLGLTDHRKKSVRQLSGGMKRRLLIAKALVHKPKLLLLDEPTAGVDVELRTQLWDFVIELNKNGVSVLLTTHYLEEAERLCDRVAIIHQGKLLKIGPTAELVQHLTQRRVEIFVSQPMNLQHPLLVSQDSQCLKFKLPYGHTLGQLLSEIQLPNESILDLKIKEGSLEEAFLSVLGGQQ